MFYVNPNQPTTEIAVVHQKRATYYVALRRPDGRVFTNRHVFSNLQTASHFVDTVKQAITAGKRATPEAWTPGSTDWPVGARKRVDFVNARPEPTQMALV